MARACSVCTHPQREEIDRALTTAQPVLRIAEEWNVAESSLRRHKRHHLLPEIADAIARSGEVTAERLLAWLQGLQEQTLWGLLTARKEHDHPAVRGYVREGRENLELLARLAGLLDGGTTITIDARKQMQVIGSMSDEDLRALAAHARELPAGELVEVVDAEAA
jgi:hypothetical protein